MPDWLQHDAALAQLAGRQLFFLGGAPRSGTTWLQQLLDAHPEVSCRGEGLFGATLATPLDALVSSHAEALAAKNARLFAHTGGYPLPDAHEADVLLGTAILLALRRHATAPGLRAIGEKTPENVFLFPRLQGLFPHAKLIVIARDPRDVLASAWHFFYRGAAGEDEAAAKLALVDSALPSLEHGARAIIEHAGRHPSEFQLVTYETLHQDPQATATRLFRFLGVADTPALVAGCVAATSFTAITGGRPPGSERSDSFLRKGIPGDWRATLSPALNERILARLSWSFAHFGWHP